MIQDCGVNRLNQFATFLAQHLRNSRQNPKLLALLQTLDDALYSGLALPREEEEWARGNGIRLRVSFISISDTILSDCSQESLWQHRMWRHASVDLDEGLRNGPSTPRWDVVCLPPCCFAI
jgi:hypothetical protein